MDWASAAPALAQTTTPNRTLLSAFTARSLIVMCGLLPRPLRGLASTFYARERTGNRRQTKVRRAETVISSGRAVTDTAT